MNKIHCKLLTPNGTIFDQNIASCILPSTEGLIGVLYGHEEMVVNLDKGVLTIKTDSQEKSYNVSPGIVHIDGKSCFIMVDKAEVC